MKTHTAQKRSSKGLINVGVVLAAFAALLLMQGAAQAWWSMASSTWLVWRGGW